MQQQGQTSFGQALQGDLTGQGGNNLTSFGQALQGDLTGQGLAWPGAGGFPAGFPAVPLPGQPGTDLQQPGLATLDVSGLPPHQPGQRPLADLLAGAHPARACAPAGPCLLQARTAPTSERPSSPVVLQAARWCRARGCPGSPTPGCTCRTTSRR